jgi:type 1 glutamine amidotransferase
MKPSLNLWAFPLLLLLAVIAPPAAQAAEATGHIKTLLITGGHGFARDPFLKVFQENGEITLTQAEHAKTNATAYERSDLLQHDVVVLYDMPASITDAQKARFLELFERGIGLVVLHHALVSYQTWPDYERIIGGRYPEPDPKKPGLVTPQVGWKHDETVPVVIVARNHPVTAGLKDFVIQDEIYWGFRVGRDVTPLLTTTHPQSGKPLAWTRTEGRSRIVFLQLGHGHSAFQDPNYRRLVAQSIRWVARRPSP